MRILAVLFCLLSFSKMVVSINDMKLEKIYERLEKLEKEKPYMSICAAKSSTKGQRGRITYDSVFHSSTNIGEGGLDKCTGVFTSGLSGSYSVSWNSFSEKRGGGDSVVLWKNGRSISETQCSWTMQGRTVMIDLKSGETVSLCYNDWNDYGQEKLSFCVSLVHAHDNKPIEGPKMRVLPISKHLKDPTYFLKLSTGLTENSTNHELAQSVENSFKEAKGISSQSCQGKSTPRKCGRECNLNDKKCDLGCEFEYDTLGECKEMPYGYVNDPSEETVINPCFFLKFDSVEYWNPDPQNYAVPEIIRRYSHDVQFQIDCQGTVDSNEIYSYAEFVQMDNGTFPEHIQWKVDYFVKNTDLYEELLEIGHNMTHLKDLIDAQNKIFLFTFDNDGEKMMAKFRNHSTESGKSQDESKDELLKELLAKHQFDINNLSYSLGVTIAFMKILETLPKNEKDKIFEKIDQRNPHERYQSGLSKTEFCKENLRLCDGNDMPVSCCSLLYHFITQDPHSMNRSLNTMELIRYIDIDEKIYDKQDVFFQIQESLSEYERVHQKLNPELRKILNDKILVDKLFGIEYDLAKFEELMSYLRDYGNRIKISFYPESQGIPRKYFPLNGDEETPYVAIKLHLEDNPGITPGQEILVTCKALYKGADHHAEPRRFEKGIPKQDNSEKGSGMVEFKIILQ